MKNKELFTLNPDENNLMNDGFVEINTAKDDQGLKIIRHELKTFVCEGEYQKGIYRMLSSYLKHFDGPNQSPVWVSGFFGSGKSHLIKMLGYFWEDFKFPNGDSARTIKQLPDDVNELLTELDRKQKIHGKLAISGTLKDFPSNDIRYSFLQLLLNALGLPPLFHLFKFIHWAKKEGIYDELKALVEADGKSFKDEYEDLFVSSSIAKAVLKLKPEFAENEAKVKENFKANFKRVERINRDQMISTIKDQILPLYFGNKIPCTIIILDEVQQFIGQDGNKTIDIQNLAQDIRSSFDGKFLLVGSGQNALSDTPMLQPLKDRFTVYVNLSDTDVETVTRKTVLEKKPTVLAALNKKIENSLGEISRNLSGTDFGFQQDDKPMLAADYPILPSTRKYWKKVLQVIDTAGTSGQLRSQLKIVDESLKSIADKEVGFIVPADLVFVQKQGQLLNNALLLQETNNMIESRKAQGGDSALEGRILSVVFLIDLLPKDTHNRLKSDEDTIAELLIDNLNETSEKFRSKVKELIMKLVDEKVLMQISDEFKLQTKVGAEWEQEFKGQVIKLQNNGDDEIQRIRKERIIEFFKIKAKPILIQHGVSKKQRDYEIWDRQERPNTDNKLNVWLRDGWNENESNVINEIRAEGAESSLSYVFIKKQRDQDLRSEIIKYLASELTLGVKGVPTDAEGKQARKSMETRRDLAFAAVKDLIETICKEGVVYLAGGNKVEIGNIGENIKDALESLADRQFPEFKTKADYKDWEKALAKAIIGDIDALKKINWTKDVKDHPVGLQILTIIGNQKKQGKDIRTELVKSPYGWSQDAIDTMIIMLKLIGQISSPEANLNQAKIGNEDFQREKYTPTAKQKMDLRALYLEAKINCNPNEEFIHSNTFLNYLKELAELISGDAPKPEPINIKFVNALFNLDGNERLIQILEQKEELVNKLSDWTKKVGLIKDREPNWNLLYALCNYLPATKELDSFRNETNAILNDRLIFNEPDLIRPLLSSVCDVLKDLLLNAKKSYISIYDKLMTELQVDQYFKKLTPEQKNHILTKHQLLPKQEIKPIENKDLFNHLQKTSLDNWQTKIAALPGQFGEAREEAILLASPKAESYSFPKGTINSKEELEEYISKIKDELEKLLKKSGSIILK